MNNILKRHFPQNVSNFSKNKLINSTVFDTEHKYIIKKRRCDGLLKVREIIKEPNTKAKTRIYSIHKFDSRYNEFNELFKKGNINYSDNNL